MFKTPILLIIFNRPDTTQKVFEAVKKIRPLNLYITGDGPRGNVPGDAEKCDRARSIIGQVDWTCDVRTFFRDRNLGCRNAVSSGVDWFFQNVEEGIVVEDDCLPHPSFFPFCEELLGRYRSDQRVMQICGSNFLQGWRRHEYSYYFSSYGPVWGWASWRRAWKHYDVDMKIWPEIVKDGTLVDICLHEEEMAWRKEIYEKLYRAEIDTWDLQWGFAKMINSGLSITPNVNLISNIGFGAEATHTFGTSDPFGSMAVTNIEFPLRHPINMVRDRLSDKRYFDGFVLRKELQIK
jgi:hypothetical protein